MSSVVFIECLLTWYFDQARAASARLLQGSDKHSEANYKQKEERVSPFEVHSLRFVTSDN